MKLFRYVKKAFLFASLLGVFLFTACGLTLIDEEEIAPPETVAYGAARITLLGEDTFEDYVIRCQSKDGNPPSSITTKGRTVSVALVSGKWEITARARLTVDGVKKVVAEAGSGEVEILPGLTTQVSITVKMPSGDDYGDLGVIIY